MARPKTEFRNEMKTRVSDRVYEGVQRYMHVNRCASEARAISDLLELALFGADGSLPVALPGSYPQTAIFGPETAFHK